MNMSFLMAGTVSTNPVLFFGGILLILAWKNAGYLGLDRVLLPALGTPWRQSTPAQAASPAATAAL
jgi:thiosulfate dehydrogenase (quinone) large subunit